ncbi:tyrosine-type recombinase/integrase [Nonomuraea sp. NPDC052129]|uniref:tyrosine-type recombinase/integrase n=1 Tax=Nonomuraea sp. NPDC052129 TaxID=3154651 RepID=UPI0034137EFF
MPGRDRGHAAQSCAYSARRSIASAIRTGTFRRGSPCGAPHGKEATPRPQDHGLVFASLVGTPLDAHNVRRAFRKIVKDAGMPAYYWTPREMRHSFVSLLSDSGVPLEDIARLVGHSGTAVTEAVYRKQIRPVLLQGAAAMDDLFAR